MPDSIYGHEERQEVSLWRADFKLPSALNYKYMKKLILIAISLVFLGVGCTKQESIQKSISENTLLDNIKKCTEQGGKLISNFNFHTIDGCQYGIEESDKREWEELECERWYTGVSSTCPILMGKNGEIDWETHKVCSENINKCWFIGQKTNIYF